MAWSVPWNLIGQTVSGDLGDLTIYTSSRKKKVVYPFSPPKEPPSYLQMLQREKFRFAQASWAALEPDEKATLEAAAIAASLCATGQNLYMSAIMHADSAGYATVASQTGLALPPLPEVPPWPVTGSVNGGAT